MLRESPYLLALITVFVALIGFGSVWYISDINEDTAVLTLNETLRSTAINQVDLSVRVKPGHVYLDQDGGAKIARGSTDEDFESEMLTILAPGLSDGSIVRFDYALVENTVDIPATAYIMSVNSDNLAEWKVWDNTYDNIRPLALGESIDGIRVRIRHNEDATVTSIEDQTDPDFWTYQSTVEVNRSDMVRDVFETVN